jgi:RNA 2',3'-cyclic 3'-phosphodiesterase
MEEKTRAFIAIEFPDEVVKEIARLQELLENRKFTGKLTELGNLHLTLKFLGEISGEKLEEVRKALAEIKFKEFEAVLSGAGTFSFRRNPRIVWVKVGSRGISDVAALDAPRTPKSPTRALRRDKPQGLFGLQASIDSALEKIGFAKENRFMSHLTLARIKYVKDKQEFVDYIDNFNVKKIKFNISKFCLKKSDLKISGPVYTTIEEYKSTI